MIVLGSEYHGWKVKKYIRIYTFSLNANQVFNNWSQEFVLSLLSLNITVIPWKSMVWRLLSFEVLAYFQGRAVSFREGIMIVSLHSQTTPGPGKLR